MAKKVIIRDYAKQWQADAFAQLGKANLKKVDVINSTKNELHVQYTKNGVLMDYHVTGSGFKYNKKGHIKNEAKIKDVTFETTKNGDKSVALTVKSKGVKSFVDKKAFQDIDKSKSSHNGEDAISSFTNFAIVSNGSKFKGSKKDDIFSGSRGNDYIDAGKGNDTIGGFLFDGGKDKIVFGKGYDKDTVYSFTDNKDTLLLKDNLWKGKKSVADVLAEFATQDGDDVVFDFGRGDSLTIKAFAVADLANDISII